MDSHVFPVVFTSRGAISLPGLDAACEALRVRVHRPLLAPLEWYGRPPATRQLELDAVREDT